MVKKTRPSSKKHDRRDKRTGYTTPVVVLGVLSACLLLSAYFLSVGDKGKEEPKVRLPSGLRIKTPNAKCEPRHPYVWNVQSKKNVPIKTVKGLLKEVEKKKSHDANRIEALIREHISADASDEQRERIVRALTCAGADRELYAAMLLFQQEKEANCPPDNYKKRRGTFFFEKPGESDSSKELAATRIMHQERQRVVYQTGERFFETKKPYYEILLSPNFQDDSLGPLVRHEMEHLALLLVHGKQEDRVPIEGCSTSACEQEKVRSAQKGIFETETEAKEFTDAFNKFSTEFNTKWNSIYQGRTTKAEHQWLMHIGEVFEKNYKLICGEPDCALYISSEAKATMKQCIEMLKQKKKNPLERQDQILFLGKIALGIFRQIQDTIEDYPAYIRPHEICAFYRGTIQEELLKAVDPKFSKIFENKRNETLTKLKGLLTESNRKRYDEIVAKNPDTKLAHAKGTEKKSGKKQIT